MMYEMNWSEYFQMMKDWKRLPAYKAEPRIDSLVGYYLPSIYEAFTGIQVRGIIPELPIRLGTIRPEHEGTNYSDRSYKVDFYVLGADGSHHFVEFKTDTRSRRDNQDQYLIQSQHYGMSAIIAGILQIEKVSTYKQKYKHLTDKLKEYGLVTDGGDYCGGNVPIEVIYIQPQQGGSEGEKVIDFRWIAEWLVSAFPEREFESQLADALLKWSED